MTKMLNLKEEADNRDFKVEQVKSETMRTNLRLVFALILLLGFSLFLILVYWFSVPCIEDVIAEGCSPETDRQWARSLLTTIIGATLGAAFSSRKA